MSFLAVLGNGSNQRVPKDSRTTQGEIIGQHARPSFQLFYLFIFFISSVRRVSILCFPIWPILALFKSIRVETCSTCRYISISRNPRRFPHCLNYDSQLSDAIFTSIPRTARKNFQQLPYFMALGPFWLLLALSDFWESFSARWKVIPKSDTVLLLRKLTT